MHHFISKHSTAQPHSVAIIEETKHIGSLSSTRTYTFQQLELDSNRVSYLLQHTHLVTANGPPIGICLDGYKSIVAILAIWKTGNAYVPLDASYPVQRLQYMVEDSGMEMVITESTELVDGGALAGGWFGQTAGTYLADNDGNIDDWTNFVRPYAAVGTPATRIKAKNRHIVQLDAEWSAIQALSNPPAISAHEVAVSASDITCILYTSGSTGKPKGVCALHTAALNRFQV
jgi:non-ribosomal peptide synthetase component F